MILMRCPDFPESCLTTFGSVMGKSVVQFKQLLRRLNFVIKGSETRMVNSVWYQPTHISEELIQHGFSPFDYKNRSLPTNVSCRIPPKECRKNLKELIVWICQTIKSQHAVPERLDLLRGEDPSFYGLSTKTGRITYISGPQNIFYSISLDEK